MTRKYFLQACLLVLLAISAFSVGQQQAEACGYNYNAGYLWYGQTRCFHAPWCDDLNGEVCWTEECHAQCVDDEPTGGFVTQYYGCDNNCEVLEYCAHCS